MKKVYLVTSGDLRLNANQTCWPAQVDLESRLTRVFADFGCELVRAFPYNAELKHGFISSQREGMDIFRTIPEGAPLVFATAAWQYTHHVLPGLRSHSGPLLTVANWSGQWPGLVGLLNLNGSLVKAGVPHSTVWSEDFKDPFALDGIRAWIEHGVLHHDLKHVRPFAPDSVPPATRELGARLAGNLRNEKSILGVFDEGCMGMYNAIIDDEPLNAIGMFKERLSQSALYARMLTVDDREARAVLDWLLTHGMKFAFGPNGSTDLTESQVLTQAKMYIAAMRIADDFGCEAIGIQYQQGLKDLVPASDLVEGLLNNPHRPPVRSEDGSRELYAGRALPHFNEVDECAGVDAVLTHRAWNALGLDPSTTLHDVRWGEMYDGEFVWLWQISGAAPASHFVDGYRGAASDRQPSMYFPLGGGTLKGIGRPGPIVWSRVFVQAGELHMDIGLGDVVELPPAETERRWQQVTTQWPMVSVVTRGVSRNAFMGRHRANHVSIAYASSSDEARHCLGLKASFAAALGIHVHTCGCPPEH